MLFQPGEVSGEYQTPREAVTEDHSWRAANDRTVLSQQSGGQKLKIKVLACWFPPGPGREGLGSPTSLPALGSVGTPGAPWRGGSSLLMGPSPCVSVSPYSSKDLGHWRKGILITTTSFELDHTCRTLSKQGRVPGTWVRTSAGPFRDSSTPSHYLVFFFFKGCPEAYGIPGVGIRCELKLRQHGTL